MDFEDFKNLDLGKPVQTGRSGRVMLGAIFLAFAAFLGLASIGAHFGEQHAYSVPALSVFIAIAIILGYIGIRLVRMSDGDHLFGRVASIVAGLFLIAFGVGMAGLAIGSGALDKTLQLSPVIFFGVAGGYWLLRSAIRRKKDEP